MGQCCSGETPPATKGSVPPAARKEAPDSVKARTESAVQQPLNQEQLQQSKEEAKAEDTRSEDREGSGVEGGANLRAPGHYPDPTKAERKDSPTLRTRPSYPVFRSDASLSISMRLSAILMPEVHKWAGRLTPLEMPLENLLQNLLRVAHTTVQIHKGKGEMSEKVYDTEKKLEFLVFGSALAVEKKLRPEIIIFLLRWHMSNPLLVRRGKMYKVDNDEPPSCDEDVTAEAAAGNIIRSLNKMDIESLSYAVKVGMRAAAKKYAIGRLDGKREAEIRKAQELRRTSWWQEIAGKDSSQLHMDENLQSFNAWRRKTISGNANLVEPISSTNDDGSRLYSIVLDLDETLIYTRGDGSHLCLRPGSQELLRCLRRLGCNIVVWTASTKDYSAAILSNIDPELEYVSECVYRHEKWCEHKGVAHARKDLSLLGRDLDNTLIVDNSVDCCIGYTETNAIIVPDFRGLELEETLPTLCEFFADLVESDMSVKDYLRHHGHKHFKIESRTTPSLKGETVQCFVVDARQAEEILPFSICIAPAPNMTLIPVIEDPVLLRRRLSNRPPDEPAELLDEEKDSQVAEDPAATGEEEK